MPINVFGNSSNNSGNKIDTSLFVQKPHLRTNYKESNREEDIDLKNQYRIKNLPDPISNTEAVSKSYADALFNDPSIVKTNAHIELNDRNITNARFIQVNQLPQIDSHLTAKLYVDNSINESSLLRLDPDETLDLENQDSIILNSTLTSPKTKIEIPTKAYIDSLHEENERARRDLDENTIVRLNDDSNDRYLQVRVDNTPYNLQIYNKTQIIDTTRIIFPNTGSDLLQ